MALTPTSAPVYTSAAHLSQFAGPTTNQRHAIVESIGLFKWYASDVTAADNVTVIAPSGGAIGRWKLSAAFPGATTWLPGVDVVATSNLDLSGLETVDGVSLTAGMVVLPTAQDNAAQNVPMVVSADAWTRPTWFDTTAEAVVGSILPVRRGTLYGGTIWQMSSPTSGSITLGTTEVEWGLYQPIALSDASPAALGSAAAGVSESVARADHVHSHGALSGGSLHSAASTSTAGFMSAADKSRVDAVYPSGAVFIAPSGSGTGVADNLAVRTALAVEGAVVVLQSAASYADDGTPIVWGSGAKLITSDGRPAFWSRGSAATSSMNALPGCINTVATSITFNLPPAANWRDQTLTIEQQAATSATVAPAAGEAIGPLSTETVSGIGDRLVLRSTGSSPIVPVSGGSPSTPILRTDQISGVSGPLTSRPAPISTTVRELDNYQDYYGDLRAATSFILGTSRVSLSLDNTFLVDEQMTGNTSATNFLYRATKFTTIGSREEFISADATKGKVFNMVGGSPFQVALGTATTPLYLSASNAGIHALELSGNGNWIARSGNGRTHSIRPGVGTIYDTDWQTASSAGLEQYRHLTTTTANATPTNLTLIAAAAITDNRTIRVSVEVLAYHATNSAGYTLSATFRKVGGTLAQIGATTQTGVHEDTAGMDATLSASAGDIIATVTGVAATTIRWETYVAAFYGMA